MIIQFNEQQNYKSQQLLNLNSLCKYALNYTKIQTLGGSIQVWGKTKVKEQEKKISALSLLLLDEG